MKNVKLFLSVLTAGVLLISSCKKTDAISNALNPAGSGDVAAGKSIIKFNTDAAFQGSTTFNVSNSLTTPTSAVSITSGSIRNVTVTATETSVSGTTATTRSAQLVLLLPPGANTNSGNLTANFAETSGTATIIPAFSLSSSNGTSSASYVSHTGTVTITKLTSTEVEGTFSVVVKNDGETITYNVTNGSFAGKF